MRNSYNLQTVTVTGKSYLTAGSIFEFALCSDAGWIRVHSTGSENIYFTFTADDGFNYEGYCKCL